MNVYSTPTSLAQAFGPQLVTLSDGRPGLRGGLRINATVPPGPASAGDAPVIDFFASDDTLDRYDEILSPEGWRLDAYRRNPVFQNAHQYGDIIHTLGKAVITEVRDRRLYQRIQFATDANPVARIAYALYRGGFLNAVSVGFIPRRWENGSAEAGFRRKYLEQELLEVSAVGIPANPNALKLGLRSGAITQSDLRELLERLRQAAAGVLSSAAPSPETPLSHRHETSWLWLARLVRDLLRGTPGPARAPRPGAKTPPAREQPVSNTPNHRRP